MKKTKLNFKLNIRPRKKCFIGGGDLYLINKIIDYNLTLSDVLNISTVNKQTRSTIKNNNRFWYYYFKGVKYDKQKGWRYFHRGPLNYGCLKLPYYVNYRDIVDPVYKDIVDLINNNEFKNNPVSEYHLKYFLGFGFGFVTNHIVSGLYPKRMFEKHWEGFQKKQHVDSIKDFTHRISCCGWNPRDMSEDKNSEYNRYGRPTHWYKKKRYNKKYYENDYDKTKNYFIEIIKALKPDKLVTKLSDLKKSHKSHISSLKSHRDYIKQLEERIIKIESEIQTIKDAIEIQSEYKNK